MSRRLLIAIVLAFFALGPSVVTAQQSRPPNIVLIVSDDQGYNDLGLGNTNIITPNLDRLAAEGVRCTNFYVTWPACTPSRGSILTGRYPQRNGLYDMIRNDVADYGYEIPPAEYAVSPERILGMDTREIMISQVLQKQGYKTAVFGKWDGGQLKRYLPLQRGFDEFYGLVNTGIDYFTHERYGVPSMYRNNELTEEDKGTYATYLFEREALRFIRENHDRPFFLYLPFNAPHGSSSLDPKIRGSVQAPQKYKDMYPHLAEESKYVKGERYGQPAMVPSRGMRKLGYLAATTCMDASIGAVLDELEKHGLRENTLVIFFSDNGGSGAADNSPLRGRKGQMFEGGIRVPFIARFPGRIPPSFVCDEFLTSLEMFPTLTAVAGGELPEDVIYDGFNMLPVLKGEVSSARNHMFWKRRGDIAARVGEWKWVDSARGTGLFNLADDIGEKNDLSKSHPQKLKELKQAFAGWMAEMEAAEPRGPFRDY
jgi:arylsulfatase A-like enzyme